MKIDWLRHMILRPTPGVWAHQNPGITAQQQAIENFCQQNNVRDCWTGSVVPNESHEMITLQFREEKFVSVETIDSMLIQARELAQRYLHLSVNKFLVFSQHNRQEHLDTDDLDLRLIRHWSDIVDLGTVYEQHFSNDLGKHGNWIYPLTNVIWAINE